MNLRVRKTLKAFGLFSLAFFIVTAGVIYWMLRTAASDTNACWRHEAAQAFQKYGALTTRSDILRVVGAIEDAQSNPIEIVEKDPNGCSFGSNGRTVLLLFFDAGNKLTTIQVFRDYITSDPGYKMELIEERKL